MDEVPRRTRERLVHEEEITKAAERIFIEKGFEEASMDEIAKEAEFTKRTLYQYFRSKEDLYLAVVLRGFKLMVGKLAVAGEGGSNGIGKIRLSFRALYGFYREHPETFKLISQWSYVKRRSLEENPAMGPQGLFYYYHTMAKALTLCGANTLTTSEGQSVNWRERLALKLINLQKADGSWANENGRWFEKDPALVTAYALIALEMIYPKI